MSWLFFSTVTVIRLCSTRSSDPAMVETINIPTPPPVRLSGRYIFYNHYHRTGHALRAREVDLFQVLYMYETDTMRSSRTEGKNLTSTATIFPRSNAYGWGPVRMVLDQENAFLAGGGRGGCSTPLLEGPHAWRPSSRYRGNYMSACSRCSARYCTVGLANTVRGSRNELARCRSRNTPTTLTRICREAVEHIARPRQRAKL